MSISLRQYGINFEGTIESAVELELWNIPELRPHFERNPQRDFWTADGVHFLKWIGPFDEGGNGNVEEWAVYVRGGTAELHFLETVYEKRSKDSNSLFVEACLQILAANILRDRGFLDVVARTRQIYRRGSEVAFTMEPFYNVVNLHVALLELCPRLTGPAFDAWFLPILIQCVLLIGTLEESVGINHRDLKGDNILISKSGDLQEREIVLGSRKWAFTFRRSVHVVDFGFSCRGSKMDGRASVSAGDFFTLTDVCPKQGRDIYVLLCYFWAQAHWRAAASAQLREVVRGFLRVQKILDHLEVHGLSRTKYIYFLLSDPAFPCACTPTAVLDSIAAAWPSALKAI